MSVVRTALHKLDARARARRRRRALRRAVAIGLIVPLTSTSCVQPFDAPRSAVVVIPVAASTSPNLARPASPIAGGSLADRQRATLCLTSAIYYEAATEPDEGQRAVAQVVLNRVAHPEWPNTVCGVVYQGSSRPGCQFSYACDGAMARAPSLAWWIRARRVAEMALAGEVYAPVGRATFYHTTAVSPPWVPRLRPVGQVGTHLFYELPGDHVRLVYVGREPHPGPLPRVAPPAQLLTVARAVPLASTPLAVPSSVATPTPTPRPSSKPAEDTRYVPGALPDSEVLPEWRNSGQWIER